MHRSSDQALRIVVVSESAWTVQDHGVHTAFVQQVRALRNEGHDVSVNRLAECNRADITIVHSPGPVAVAALTQARGVGVAMAHITPSTLHDSLRGEVLWRGPMTRYLLALYRRADIVIAVSAPVAAELAEIGVNPARTVVVPLGIDPCPRVDHCDAPQQPIRTRPLVLGVGQLQPRKGIDRFATIARCLPQYDFIWAGGRPFGPLTAGGYTRRNLAKSSPPNLCFTGRVDSAELERLYRSADAFLFPSRQESFGQVVIEAGLAGLPLLLTPLAPFKAHFATGSVLATPTELPSVLSSLLEQPGLRDWHGTRARELARHYSAARSASELVRVAGEFGRLARTVAGHSRAYEVLSRAA